MLTIDTAADVMVVRRALAGLGASPDADRGAPSWNPSCAVPAFPLRTRGKVAPGWSPKEVHCDPPGD